jgi:hypothetical protein
LQLINHFSVGEGAGLYLDGVHDDSETGNGKLVWVPQVMVVEVTAEKKNTSLCALVKKDR